MTTILTINLIQRYGLDKGKFLLKIEIAIRVSKNASAMSGTTAQLKYTKWVRL